MVMYGKLERTWGNAFMAYFKVTYWHLLEELRKIIDILCWNNE
jgi:hypothetical protein